MIDEVIYSSIGLILGGVGSLLCFYYPEILSKNIEPIKVKKVKLIFSCFCIIGSLGLIYFFSPKTFEDWISYFFAFVFYLIAWVDGYSKIIPNRLLTVLILIAGLGFWLEPDFQKVVAFSTVIIISILVYQVGKRLLSKKMLGWGDVKLIAVLALFIGWEFLKVTYIAIIFLGLFASIGIILKKFTKHTKLSAGTFLLIAYLIWHEVMF